MDLSIVLVSWNCADHLERALASIVPTPDLETEVFVVDNASNDGTPAMVAERFPGVDLTANDDNRGFAAANNQALRRARGRHVLLLNPDTEVRPGALARMVDHLDRHPELGALGPQLVYPDGRLQRSATIFPTMRAALHRFTAVRFLRIFGRHYRRYKMKEFPFEQITAVDSLMGAALMIPRRVLEEVGLLDEGFWMYYEEVDLCKRIREAGFENRFYPEAQIVHVGGESSSRNVPTIRYERLRSLLRYFTKHRGPTEAFLFRTIFKAAFLVRLALAIPGDALLWLLLPLVGRRARAGEHAGRLAVAFGFLRHNLIGFLRAGRPA